ncbi:hypothetical protein MRU69_02735 [Kocuria flava]|uniref:hypothetical protein n=1 Tax=Kocuria flava TaxID=446860 RepID=UPI001FF34FE4|nr:hypothetical protein [Kocuria flava]MCJ8503782.1 hypothetical protein [Kocuria flava]
MAQKTPRYKVGLDHAFEELATPNPDGTYSVRIPSEGDRVIVVPTESRAKVVAEAEALRIKLSPAA